MLGVEPYRTWSAYLRERFGKRVHKVSLDVGSTCPHRSEEDKGLGGCIFCDRRGGGSGASLRGESLEEQVERGTRFATSRFKAQAVILYLQSYTPTLLDASNLEDVIERAVSVASELCPVVGISVATRPDTLKEEHLELLLKLRDRGLEVWVEVGAQSLSTKSLMWLNRRHGVSSTIRAFQMLSEARIKACAHVILGIPVEEEEETVDSVVSLSLLGALSFKFHPLHVLKGTPLHQMLLRGEYVPLRLEDYIRTLSLCISSLPEEAIIQRVSAEAPSDLLVAPQWCLQKQTVIRALKDYMSSRGLRQGSTR